MAFCKSCKNSFLDVLRNNTLFIITISAIFVGVALGISLRNATLSYDHIAWITIWGEVFMRMLKAVILPLVATCLIVGITSMDEQSSKGRIGLVTLGYISFGNLIGSTLGVILAVVIRPGVGFDKNTGQGEHEMRFISNSDIFLDLIRNLLPDNIIRAALQSAYTEYDITWNVSNLTKNSTNFTENHVVDEVIRTHLYRDVVNTIGVVVLSLVVGLGINAAGEEGAPLLSVIKSLYAVVEKILIAIFWYAPVGICSLIAGAMIQVDNLELAVTSLGLFVLTFFVCFLIHFFVYMPGLYFAVCRKNPFIYYGNIMTAIIAGFAPPSSSAALPYLLETTKCKLNIRSELANFILPLETMINRDGSAMFISLAAVFVAQSSNIQLDAGSYMIIILMTFILSMATGTTPSGSVVVLVIVCSMVNIPLSHMLGLIMVPEFINDRLRTVNNVASHGFGCAIIQQFCPAGHSATETVHHIKEQSEPLFDGLKDSSKYENARSHGRENTVV